MLKILNFFSTKKAAAASPAVDTHENSISRSSQQTIDGAVTYALVVNAEICVIQLTLVWVLFKGKLMNDIQNSNCYSLSFDESLNRVTSKLRNGPHRQIPDH